LVHAVAEVRVRGRNDVRHLWDPVVNPRLKARASVENWLNIYRGMLGFVLAHELGHIHLNKPLASEDTQPLRPTDRRDQDLRWACWDLLSSKWQHQQQVEAEADRFAARLIAQVLFPEGALRVPLLWYELGAHTYLLYALNPQILDVINVTESDYIRRALQIQLGTELYSGVAANAENSGKGALHVVFPKRHPASVRRVEQLLGTMSQSPYSYHHGKFSDYPELAALKMVIEPACAELKQKYGVP
jgi:hypothetical protein